MVAARSKAAGSRYLSARPSAASRDAATRVEKVTRTVVPGSSRTRRRRLKMGSSTAPAVLDSGRPSITDIGVRMPRPRPRKRSRSVSYWAPPTVSPCTATTCAAQGRGSPSACGRREASSASRPADMLGLHEQVREGGMSDVGAGRRQHHLGVGGHLDLARPQAVIGERYPADLGVVLRRHHHLEPAGDGAVAAPDLGAVLGEDDLVAVRLDAARLEARRPDLAALHVAQEDEAPPAVAGDVLPEAGDRQLPHPAVAGAGRRQHHRVAAVAEQMGARHRVVGGAIAAHHRRRQRVRLPPPPPPPRRAAAPPPRRAASAPAAAARWPAPSARRGTAPAWRRRGRRRGCWPAPAATCPGGAPCRRRPPPGPGLPAAGWRCSRPPRRSRSGRRRRPARGGRSCGRPPAARTSPPARWRRGRSPGPRRGRASSRARERRNSSTGR